jgi:hypothetical protein
MINHLDSVNIVKKIENSRNDYKDALLKVLRYNHFGQVVPTEIEPIIKHYFPHSEDYLQ